MFVSILPTLGLQARAKCTLGEGFVVVKTILLWGLRVKTGDGEEHGGGSGYSYQTTKRLLGTQAHQGGFPDVPE